MKHEALLIVTLLALSSPTQAEEKPEPNGPRLAKQSSLYEDAEFRDGQWQLIYKEGFFQRKEVARGVLLQLAEGISAERAHFPAGSANAIGLEFIQDYLEESAGDRRDEAPTLVQIRGDQLLLLHWEAGTPVDDLERALKQAWEHQALPPPSADRVVNQGVFVGVSVVLAYNRRPAVTMNKTSGRFKSVVVRSVLWMNKSFFLMGESESKLAPLKALSDKLMGQRFFTGNGFMQAF